MHNPKTKWWYNGYTIVLSYIHHGMNDLHIHEQYQKLSSNHEYEYTIFYIFIYSFIHSFIHSFTYCNYCVYSVCHSIPKNIVVEGNYSVPWHILKYNSNTWYQTYLYEQTNKHTPHTNKKTNKHAYIHNNKQTINNKWCFWQIKIATDVSQFYRYNSCQSRREPNTNTHTHTHVCFCELWGLSIDFYYFYTDQTIISYFQCQKCQVLLSLWGHLDPTV